MEEDFERVDLGSTSAPSSPSPYKGKFYYRPASSPLYMLFPRRPVQMNTNSTSLSRATLYYARRLFAQISITVHVPIPTTTGAM